MGLDWSSLLQISCNASIIPALLNSKGEPLDDGRAQRSFPISIRRAVILRDDGCAYPSCLMPHMLSDLHHIVHWQNGRSTSLDNAVMLCPFPHNIIHQHKMKVRLNENQFPEYLLEPNAQQEAWLRNIVHRGT